MARNKKVKVEEKGGGGESGSGRWMLTYLDMVTLLFGVFVVLYAMSVIDQKKFDEVAESIRMGFQGGGKSVFNYKAIGGTTIIPGLFPPGSRIQSEFQKIADVLKTEMQQNVINVHEDERGIVISMAADIFFESGTARLTEDARYSLDKIAPVLVETKRKIRIEGYTDDAPVSIAETMQSQTYQDNWELGAMRAINVLRYVVDRGVEREKLSAQTFADNLPLAKGSLLPPEESPERRALNRRVDIVILRDPKANK